MTITSRITTPARSRRFSAELAHVASPFLWWLPLLLDSCLRVRTRGCLHPIKPFQTISRFLPCRPGQFLKPFQTKQSHFKAFQSKNLYGAKNGDVGVAA